MCTRACLDFALANLTAEDINGRSVLEVGSLDVNGSVRPMVMALRPASYLGVDLQPGAGVDEICDATGLVPRFGVAAFDLVISTELLEHVRDWRRVISQLKQVLKPGGDLMITTRSRGFPYHGFPDDFWRFERSDFIALFSDFEIDKLESDPSSPGVLFKGRKPADFREIDTSTHALYSVVLGARLIDLTDADLAKFRRRQQWRRVLQAPERWVRRLRKTLRR